MTGDTEATLRATFELPGEAVFPESIGVDQRSGDAYVGSLADGTLYRLAADTGSTEIFSPAGEDGRASVAGVKIGPDDKLWAAGGYDGKLWIYDLARRRVDASFDVGTRGSCVNDIAFGTDGEAYVTDSLIPTLFRVGPARRELEPWVDLREYDVPWPDGLNLNGIVVTADGRHVVTCQTNTGRFWRVALDGGAVDEVALNGGPLEYSDGLARSGSTLYAAVNARNRIAVIELAPDGGSGAVRRLVSCEAFAFPTAIAIHERRLFVVNGQLDKMGSEPEIPFTVVVIDAP